MNKTKPPLGVYPRELYDQIIQKEISLNGGMDTKFILQQRINALQGAILRYTEAKLYIKQEWVEEYNSKLINLNDIR